MCVCVCVVCVVVLCGGVRIRVRIGALGDGSRLRVSFGHGDEWYLSGDGVRGDGRWSRFGCMRCLPDATDGEVAN